MLPILIGGASTQSVIPVLVVITTKRCAVYTLRHEPLELGASRVISQGKLFERIGYEPHRGQWEFHTSPARFKVATCGRRYGKSTMAARDAEPDLFKPDGMYWIVGPTYDLGEKEFRIIWDDLVRGLGLGDDKRIRKGYNKKSGTMFIEFPWNTRIEVRSADHPENLVGESLDGVIMAEAAKHKHETWQRFIRPALADKRGWATFCTTPEGHNWVYDVYMLGQDPAYPEWASWRLPSWENSVVFPGGRRDSEILLVENTTSPEWFMQEYGAEFTAFVGKIYPEFDDQKHIVDYSYNPNWPNYLFVDWGFVNAMVMLDVQISPTDDVYIWRETYVKRERVEEIIQMYKGYEQPPGHHIASAFADAADPEAIQTMNQMLCPTIGMGEAKENWRRGIEVVKQFLKPLDTGVTDDFGEPITKPKLFVDRSCRNTIREFQNYKMAAPSRVGNDPQEKPLKKDDHAMDAIRYGLMHLFELGAQHHLDETMDFQKSLPETSNTGFFTTADVGAMRAPDFDLSMEF